MSLPLTSLAHPQSHDGRRLPRFLAEELLLREPGYREPQIDAVEQRSGKFLPVELRAMRVASARSIRIPLEATGTRVRGGYQREPGGELRGAARACDHDATVLEWLAEALQGVAPELGE